MVGILTNKRRILRGRGLNMKVLVNSMTQEELNRYLEHIIEAAFREGVLWARCGGEEFCSIGDAINSAQNNIVYNSL